MSRSIENLKLNTQTQQIFFIFFFFSGLFSVILLKKIMELTQNIQYGDLLTVGNQVYN